jgi:hypothetical protein
MALPTWRIQIQKSIVAESWSNDYLTDDLTIEDAQDLANELITWERNIHSGLVIFEYVRISSYIPGDRTFRHLAINLPGLTQIQEHLPLFNTMRVDLGTANSDPARKYYRLPVSELTQQNGAFNTQFLADRAANIQTYLVTPLVLGHIVTTKGNSVVSATVHRYVQMRQLTRRRRKKLVP